jgi:hypothetical protein
MGQVLPSLAAAADDRNGATLPFAALPGRGRKSPGMDECAYPPTVIPGRSAREPGTKEAGLNPRRTARSRFEAGGKPRKCLTD